METKRIDFTKDTIPAAGKHYRVMRDLTIARFKELEKLEVELFYGVNMEQLFNKLREVYTDLNKSKPADAAIKVHKLMEGVADRVDLREPAALRLCALFLVTDDEDTTLWSDALAEQKIKDWQEEGYVMDDFLSLAGSVVPGFIASYNAVLQNTFLNMEEEKERPLTPSEGKKKK